MATTYDEYYKKYMDGADTSAYDKMASDYAASVDQDAASQIEKANTAAKSNLKQAYITRMQDQRTLNDNLARSGIRGGATETANLKLATNYGNTRNAINTQLASSIDDINRTATQSKLAYQQDIDAKKQAYIENRQAEARQAAREQVTNDQNRADMLDERTYQREQDKLNREESAAERAYQHEQDTLTRKDALNERKYQREQTKRTQTIEKYTAKYSKYYDVKKLQKLAKKAKTALEKQVINARIGYLKSPEYKQAKKSAK